MEINQEQFSDEVKNKYVFDRNTFRCVQKDDWKDRIITEVGDAKQPNFEPQMKIERWGEVNCSFRLVHNEANPVVETEGDKIKWQGDKTEAHFYDLPHDEENPEGGFEFEVILKEKPLTNKLEFSLNTKGLKFCYQSELTQQEKDEGCIRPDNIVGSYSVYTSEEKINYVGGKEYKCGKVGHIYRPRIIDNIGNWIWGILNIDVEKGILSVEIPQEFLDNAVYPIKHAAGLTFGYTSNGASSYNIIDYIRMSWFECPNNGTADSISIRIYNNQINSSVQALLYAYIADNDAGDRISYESTYYSTYPNIVWQTNNYTDPKPTLVANTKYFIGGRGQNNYSSINLYYDSEDNKSVYLSSIYGTPPSTLTDEIGYNHKYSAYITYTQSGSDGRESASGRQASSNRVVATNRGSASSRNNV